MFSCEIRVKIIYEFFFAVTIFLTMNHVRIQIVNHPMLRDSHVRCERHSVNDRDSILAIQIIIASIVYERRNEKLVAIVRV